MTRRILSHSINVEFIECAGCGMTFGMTEDFIGRRRKDGKTFYCPDGHTNFYRDNEHDRVRRERDLLKQQLAQKGDEIAAERQRRLAAEKQAATQRSNVVKLRKRTIINGVCPCCTRSFVNMKRHMATKHPGFKAEEAA